jgi:hypothetical protein
MGLGWLNKARGCGGSECRCVGSVCTVYVVALYRDAVDEYGECGALECGYDGSDMWVWCLRT